MGACCGKCSSSGHQCAGPAVPSTSSCLTESRMELPKCLINPVMIDHVILDLLKLITTFIDNDEEAPLPLVKLHVIADKEEGWYHVVSSMIHVIPLENPLGPSAITIVFDDCPLPAQDTVVKLTRLLGLSAMRAMMGDLNIRVERNICVVLGCIADKLTGPKSIAVLTEETLDYMLAFLMFRREPRILLFALTALEKFAHTTENRLTIKGRLDALDENPLIILEEHADSLDPTWRQVGFCARWCLDNVFVPVNRILTYERVDTSNINAILNNQDASEYLKISCDGLEARCDSYSFESVRCTFQINTGCWYYECTIITSGVMQIGWATKNSHFLNHEGFGIGDDLYSLSYDGCRKLIWHEAKPTPIPEVESWQPGDTVGCLIDMDCREAIFYLNGFKIRSCTALFESTRQGFHAAASFMAFQQCRFNFGSQPFNFPPVDRRFKCFNDFGVLTAEDKMVIPRRILLKELQDAPVKDDVCPLCCDAKSCCTLLPCLHTGFCSVCTAQLRECPMCRNIILNVRTDSA